MVSVLWVGPGLFSCARMCLLPKSGWWVWVRFFGLGIKGLCERAHCRVHVQHRVSVHLLWWLSAQPASDCCVVGVGVCGGLFVICIVVASIFVLYCFLCFV